jgi:DNA-binding NtrC family response regulator
MNQPNPTDPPAGGAGPGASGKPSMASPRVLVVDDDPTIREMIAGMLRTVDLHVTPAPDGAAALEQARETEFDVAIVDLSMPGLSGMNTLRRLKEIRPDLEAVILTGHPSVESSLEAIHEHVFDYLCKPVSLSVLARTVLRAVERRSLIMQNRALLRQLEEERNGLRERALAAERALEQQLEAYGHFVGDSEAIARVRRQVADVAPTDMNVLLRGESGTGKDVVAHMISDLSARKGGLVKINCPAIPETLLESELFGHEPGAFTGAERRKPGRFELAVSGTVLLDEIGEIPLALQSKLLQVIEQKEFTRLGGRETIRVDVRIVAATNAPLESMIAAGNFRSDLFYRLNEYSITLPSLRDRIEDIPLLVRHFSEKYGEVYDHKDLSVSPATMARLMRYRWPGNVRELEVLMRRFALTGEEESILVGLEPDRPVASAPGGGNTLQEAEAHTILIALTKCRWNQRQAAKELGISYSSLRRRIAKYDLKSRPFPPHLSEDPHIHPTEHRSL